MANDQLVKYIQDQSRLGVSKEALERALLDAGWVKQDIDEAFAAVASARAVSVASVTPDTSKASSSVSSSSLGSSPDTNMSPASFPRFGGEQDKPVSASITGNKPVDPSGGEKKSFIGFRHMGKDVSEAQASRPVVKNVQSSSAKAEPVSEGKKEKNAWRTVSFMLIAIAVVFAGGVAYLYVAWGGELKNLRTENMNFTSQVSALQRDIQATGDLRKMLEDNLSLRTGERDELITELSFIFRIPSLASGTEGRSVAVKGALELEKGVFTLRTAHGIGVVIVNSKEEKVAAALTPLVGQSIELTGVYIVGSNRFTAIALNGNSFENYQEATSEGEASSSPSQSQ